MIPTENNAAVAPAAGSGPRWNVMQMAFGDTLHGPRQLVLEVHPPRGPGPLQKWWRYVTCSECGGIGIHIECSLRTQSEWIDWVDRFSDDLTGRELREAKQAALAEFAEPQWWLDFRRRHAETGDPWIQDGWMTKSPNTQAEPRREDAP